MREDTDHGHDYGIDVEMADSRPTVNSFIFNHLYNENTNNLQNFNSFDFSKDEDIAYTTQEEDCTSLHLFSILFDNW